MMRSSTFVSDFRKLSVDVRQWKEPSELTSERLSEICCFIWTEREQRVGADGSRPLFGQDIRFPICLRRFVSTECVFFTTRSGTA